GNLVGTGDTKAAAIRSLKEAIARAKTGSHNPHPRLTREQKDYWLDQKDYWENVEGAITRKAKKYAWEDLYKKYPELRRSSSNTVSELMDTFCDRKSTRLN